MTNSYARKEITLLDLAIVFIYGLVIGISAISLFGPEHHNFNRMAELSEKGNEITRRIFKQVDFWKNEYEQCEKSKR